MTTMKRETYFSHASGTKLELMEHLTDNPVELKLANDFKSLLPQIKASTKRR